MMSMDERDRMTGDDDDGDELGINVDAFDQSLSLPSLTIACNVGSGCAIGGVDQIASQAEKAERQWRIFHWEDLAPQGLENSDTKKEDAVQEGSKCVAKWTGHGGGGGELRVSNALECFLKEGRGCFFISASGEKRCIDLGAHLDEWR